MSDPKSSLSTAQAAAAAYLRRLQLQGALSGHSSTFDALRHQEEQLFAARMLLQQSQRQRQHQPFGGFLGPTAGGGGGGGVYPRESLLAATATANAQQGDVSAFSATLTAAAKAAEQAEKDETEYKKKKKEAESEEEGKSEVEEEERVSDDEYFKNYSLHKVSTTASAVATKEDGSTEATLLEEADEKIEIESFPHKLYRMLYEAEKEDNEHIVSFLPSGRGFAIHDAKEFADCIMGRYFTTRRLASFQRQLNLYGFRRISEGKEKGGYFHKDFIKGKRHLSKKIRRKSTASRMNLAGAPTTSFRRLSSAGSNGLAPAAHFPSSIWSGRNSATGSMFGLGQYPHPATTKELLLAGLANNNNNNTGVMHGSASARLLGSSSLLDMTRQGCITSQHRNGASSSSVNHHEILRRAAASLALASQNQNEMLF